MGDGGRGSQVSGGEVVDTVDLWAFAGTEVGDTSWNSLWIGDLPSASIALTQHYHSLVQL